MRIPSLLLAASMTSACNGEHSPTDRENQSNLPADEVTVTTDTATDTATTPQTEPYSLNRDVVQACTMPEYDFAPLIDGQVDEEFNQALTSQRAEMLNVLEGSLAGETEFLEFLAGELDFTYKVDLIVSGSWEFVTIDVSVGDNTLALENNDVNDFVWWRCHTVKDYDGIKHIRAEATVFLPADPNSYGHYYSVRTHEDVYPDNSDIVQLGVGEGEEGPSQIINRTESQDVDLAQTLIDAKTVHEELKRVAELLNDDSSPGPTIVYIPAEE